ncbi:MAG: mechanosensitive ion channel family protein [Rhizobiaceae bacterium]|nr:mechanosensitive ion channel family protein [Hyphomicrobiales bacterium]NRB32790.1 mechanosensitive ion channel family protein [Rhizobiaceae bacterium]
MEATTTTELPAQLTREAVDQFLGQLSDKEVRQALRKQLVAVADKQAAEASEVPTTVEFFGNALAAVGNSIYQATIRIPNIGSGLARAWNVFLDGRGFSGFLLFLVKAGVLFGAGYLVMRGFDILTRGFRRTIHESHPTSLVGTTKVLFLRLGLDLARIAAFTITVFLLLGFVSLSEADQTLVWRFARWIVIPVMVFAALGSFLLAPRRPELRLLEMDTSEVVQLYWFTAGLALMMGLNPFMIPTLQQFGIGLGELRIGFWFNLALYVYLMVAIFRSRKGIAQALTGSDDLIGSTGEIVAIAWPFIAMALCGLVWLVVEAIVGLGRFDLISGGQDLMTLVIVAFFPSFDTALRGLVKHLSPPMIGDGPIAEHAHLATKRAYLRMGRLLLAMFIIFLLTSIWDIDLFNEDSDNVGLQLISHILGSIVYFIIGYLLWEAVGLWANRRLAKEHTEAGMDMSSDEPGGGEGGGAGLSRLATVLPVLKLALQTIIIVLTILVGLSELGVNTTPLLAGAGVVGLAIGFGAQTLVKDVVSGVFFLVDDAFRVGEYLVIGTTVGTVEKISFRSLQLRHHEGPIHTIPYGDIQQVTNNSRDWVIMKLKFTFPFETDSHQIKKIFKKIGAEMLEADYANDLIQTFKSQGVYDVDDVGVVIRGKFMAKPGTQWVIRKDIYTRVQKALDAAGIQFARREVRVQIPGLRPGEDLTEEQAKAIGAAATDAANAATEGSKT